MLPQLMNMLSWWQWAILAAVPPAIIALYFLKLKRRPVEVPSTYLWHKSIEDLHVNTIWQRLRRNLLLWLQLLVLALAMLALLRPGWRGMQLSGKRFVFLVDNSASMQATDVAPSRLEEAKRRVGELIDQMRSGDVAMLVSFADTARIEQTFTDNRRQLRRSLEAIQPTQRSTSLLEALKVASGLANPGRSAEDVRDVQVAEALPAKLFIVSDGKFEDVSGFSLGNLEPVFVPIAAPEAANVGIVAFSVRRHELRPDQLQAFARLENFSPKAASVGAELFLQDRLIDADRFQIAAGESRGVAFDLGAVTSGVLRLKVTTGDHLAVDDEAWLVVSPPRRANVLLVTPGNEPLELALKTASASETINLEVESPEVLEKEPYLKRAAEGAYDLAIFDRCRPEKMPQCNTLFVGILPPAEAWSAKPKLSAPQIIDTDPAHPMMQWIDMGNVMLAEGAPLMVPAGGRVLIDSDVGPMLAVAPRERFEDAVLGFALLEEVPGPSGKPEKHFRTDWPFRPSFPVFVLNTLHYLGGGRNVLAEGSVRPGQPVTLKAPLPRAELSVRTPAGQTVELKPTGPGQFSFTATARPGVYEVRSGGRPIEQFAVNLFDGAESDIRPRAVPIVKIGYVEVSGQSGWEVARREIWKSLLLVGLVVLLIEWYTYTQRVSL